MKPYRHLRFHRQVKKSVLCVSGGVHSEYNIANPRPVNMDAEYKAKKHEKEQGNNVPCYDPATHEFMGSVPAMNRAQVEDKIAAAHKAAEVSPSNLISHLPIPFTWVLHSLIKNKKGILAIAGMERFKLQAKADAAENTP